MLVVVAFGAIVPLGLMAWLTLVTPSFLGMFADFGAALPRATILVLQPWWGPALAAVYLVALLAPFLFRTSGARDFALLCVVVAGLLAVMTSAALLYLPIFAVAQRLQP